MAINWALSLVSASMIMLILFNMSQVSSSTNSTGGEDQNLDGTSGMPSNASGACNNITSSSRQFCEEFALPGEFSFHAGVYVDTDYICGGVLIDDHRILTSKECSEAKHTKMVVTVDDFDRTMEDGELTLDVKRIEKHPSTNLAILFIDRIPLEASPNTGNRSIKPIALPDGPQIVRGELTVTGWGSNTFGGQFSARLKRTVIPVSRCREPKTGYFCSPQSSVGPCAGDGGGPAFNFVQGGGFKLAGIVADSSCGGECNNPKCDNYFVNISQHLEWIENTH